MAENYYLHEVDSTNRFLSEWLFSDNSLPHGTVVRTSFQTKGRGQSKNSWESDRDKNLLFSLLLRPANIAPSEQFILSQIVALALKETVEHFTCIDVKVKWPNDIYVGNLKIAGILIENNIRGNSLWASVVGVGLNVNQTIFVGNAPNPTSMKLLTGTDFDLEKVFYFFISRITSYFVLSGDEWKQRVKTAYMSSLFHGKGMFRFRTGEEVFRACIGDILPTGQLILHEDNGVCRSFSFKEVEFLF